MRTIQNCFLSNIIKLPVSSTGQDLYWCSVEAAGPSQKNFAERNMTKQRRIKNTGNAIYTIAYHTMVH